MYIYILGGHLQKLRGSGGGGGGGGGVYLESYTREARFLRRTWSEREGVIESAHLYWYNIRVFPTIGTNRQTICSL